MRRLFALLLSGVLLFSAPARALDIELISGDWQPIHIAVELFLGEEDVTGEPPSDIISADLTASGNFRVYKETQNFMHGMTEERLNDIRDSGSEYLLTGQITTSGGGSYTLIFNLYDTLTGNSIGNYSIPFSDDNKRLASHNVANWIYEEIIGKAGVFHTKIAYVVRDEDGNNELKIADYDGHNRLTILSSENNIISPAWSPDGNNLLYVSFEQDKPVIYQQSLVTGNRQIVANFKGSNSAPAMAPDNRTIAAALTEHGDVQQIYLLSDSRKSRLRTSKGINTEPAFSPDGNKLAFTSDEGGSPHIYEYDLNNNTHRRLTFDSRYNVSPTYSSQGDTLAFIRRDENGNNIALLDIRSKTATPITDIRLADSPSFSPNDDIIAFVDESRKKNLATISINGRIQMFWEEAEAGEIIDPVWSPIKSNWF